MEEQNPIYGFLPAGGRPARNPEITQQLDYYPNEYDKGYREGYNQEWNRSANQSGLEALGYGLASRTLSIIPKLGAGLGSILGAGSAIYNKDITDVWDNPITEWFNSLDEGLKESMPVYTSQKNATSRLLGKMSTASFWASDVFDGLAYAASAFVPGAVIGKAASGISGAIKATEVGASIADKLGKIGVTAHRASLLSSTAYNVISEASAEAFQTQKELEAIYLSKGYDAKEAKDKAGESAARVFNANLGVLAVPDLIQNMFFHGGWNNLTKKVRAAVGEKGTLEGVKELSSSWTKAAGISIASEGFWEENIQTTLQQWEKNAAKSGNIGDKRGEEIATNYANNIGAFFDSFIPGKQQTSDEIEAATSIFLGGVIGLGAATRGHFQDKKALKELGASELERYNKIPEIHKVAHGLFKEDVKSIFKTNGTKTIDTNGQQVEVNDYEFDSKDLTILNDEAIHRKNLNSLRSKLHWDAQMVAAYHNNPALAELDKHMMLGGYVFNLMNNKYEYSAEEVGKHLENLTKIGTEEAAKEGVDSYITDNMAIAKQFAEQFESLRSKHSSIAKDASKNINEAGFSDFITKTEFYLEIKKKALETIYNTATTESGKESVGNMLNDTNEYLDQIKNQRASIKKEYMNSIVTRNTKIGELNSTKDSDRKKALQYQLDEDAAINGKWDGTNNSRELPSQEARELTKIKPGSKDFYQYGVGKTALTIDRTAAALDANQDISDIADKFQDGIKTIPAGQEDLVLGQQQIILDRLAKEDQRVQEDVANIHNILSGLEFVEGDQTAGESFSQAFGLPIENIQGFLDEINAKGTQFTLDTPVEEVMNSPQYGAVIAEFIEKYKTAGDQTKHLAKLTKKVREIDLNNKQLKEYQAAPNKEEFFKKQYYELEIKKGAQSFIEDYEKDPEAMMADDVWQGHNYNLELAALGSDVEEIVNDAKEKLAIFNKIWNQILKNLNNRAAIHNTINKLVVESMMGSLPIAKDGVIAKELGDNLITFLEKIKQDDVNSFDAIVSLLGKVKTLSPEVIEQVKANIKSTIDKKALDFIDKTYTKYPGLSKLFDAYRVKGTIQEKIYLPTQALLALHFKNKYGDNPPPEYTRFTADLDMFLLNLSLGKSLIADKEDKQLVRDIHKIYFDAIGANIVNSILDSTLDTNKLEIFKEAMKETTPSLQQNIALTQAITFLKSKTSNQNFGAWLLVRGVGGSGKTFFIGNQLKKLSDELLGRESKILAFSKETGTSNNINKSIFGEKFPNTTYDTFNTLSEDVLKELDFLVIDEIFTFTNSEIEDIRSRAAKAGVKVIALGDASQLTAEEEPSPLGATTINMTIPLTTSYRTNVSSIASFTNKYRLNPNTVESHLASANLPIEELVTNPSKGYGVLAVTPEGLDALLRTPSSRSRVLVVPNNNVRQNMQANYPGLDVRTPSKTQGIQWEEVYTMLDNDLGNNPFESNRVLYTAYSRAKSLLVVVDPSVNNAAPSLELEAQVKNSDKELADIAEMFALNMKGIKDLRDVLNGVAMFSPEETNKDEIVYEYEPSADASISNAMGTDLVEDQPDIPVLPTGNTFYNPTNYGLTDWGDPANAKLAKGSVVHFVKTIAPDKTISYFVLGEDQNKRGSYFEVAKLSREDFEGSAKVFLNNVTKSSKEPIDESLITGRREIPADDINRVSSGTVLVTDYLKFKTLYGATYHTTRDLTPGANDIIEDAVIRAWNTYKDLNKEIDKPWVTTKDGISKVNWENIPDGKVSMLIPTKLDTKAADGFGWNSQEHLRRSGSFEFSVAYGVPYMVIYMESEGKKPLLIRFQPKMLSKDNKYVKAIRDLKSQVDVVERLTGIQLGSEEFATLIRDYAHTNFRAEERQLVPADTITPIPDVPQSVELEDAVQNIVKLLFTSNNEAVYFRTEENAKDFLEKNGTPIKDSEDRYLNGKRIVSISAQSPTVWVYNWATDPTDKTSTAVYTEWKISEGHGVAQIVLNSLAQANNRIGHKQFRQTQVVTTKAKVLKIVRSPSILRDFTKQPYRDYAGFYKDPFTAEYLSEAQINDFLIRAKKIDENPNLAGDLLDTLAKAIAAKENASYGEAFQFAMEMTDQYKAEPITSRFLEEIAGDGAFDAQGEHTQLRTPLSLTSFARDADGNKVGDGVNDLGKDLKKEANRNLLSRDIRHNFEGFQKTQIFYDHPEIGVTELPKVDTKVTTVQELLNKVKSTGVETYDNIINLLKKLKINASVVQLPHGVPYIDETGKPATRPGASTVVTDGTSTIYTHAYNFNNINSDVNKLRIFLHESLHVASKEALEKGMSDSRKKLDTKEALFYRRIISIKKRFDAAVRSKRNPATGQRFKTSEVYEQTISKLDVNEFIASLSNPQFVELAKSISLLPDSKNKSLLRELLETIVDFFKSILGGNPSVYDAAIASLEEFYSTMDTVVLPEAITPQVVFKPEELISDITSQIDKASEFSFDNIINSLKAKYKLIVDESSFPTNYGDDYTLELDPNFEKLNPIEQSILAHQSKASFAWYDVTKDRITYTTGSIGTASGVSFTLDKLIEDKNFSLKEKVMLRSIITQEVLGDKVLSDLIAAKNKEQVLEIMFSKVFSNKDKQQFRIDLGTDTDLQTAAHLLEPISTLEEIITESIDFIVGYIKNNDVELRRLVEQSRDRSTARYRIAKQYVERLILYNIKLDKHPNPQELIKTTPYLRDHIKALVTDPNPILSSGLTLVEAVDQLNQMYEKVKTSKVLAERSQLLVVDIPRLENEITAIRMLGSTPSGSSKLVVDLILKDIYPTGDFSDPLTFHEELNNLAEEGYIEKSDIDTESLELSGIGEYVKKYDQSYETTLSESLKNSFRKITLDGEKAISPGLAYIKTMQLVMSLDWNIHTNEDVDPKSRPLGLQYIRKQLKAVKEDSTSKLTEAIVNNLIEIIDYSYSGSDLDVSIKFGDRALGIVPIKQDDNTIWYAAYDASVNIPNAASLTYKEIEYLQTQGEDIWLSRLSKNTDTLYVELHKRQPLSVKQFNRLFAKSEALNTIRAVSNTMASMKETELYTANRSSRKGNEFIFQRGVASGVTYRIKDQIKSNLINFYENGDLPALKELFHAKTVNGVRMDKLKELKKLEYIKNFFDFLGVTAPDIELRGRGITNMVNKIEGFLNATGGVEKYTLEDELGENSREIFDILDWLNYGDGVDGYIGEFSKTLSTSNKLVRNQSVKDARGKKFYTNHESSHFYKTMLNLIEVKVGNPVFQGGTGHDALRVIPDFLKSPLAEDGTRLPSYYDHNIFVRGKINNKLYSVGEVDGARNTMNNSVTDYTRENMFYFFHRNFAQQFIDGIRQNKNTYYQSTFIPSDSPKALVVRVGLLGDEADDKGKSPILGAIEQMFQQILPRVGLNGAKFKLFDDSLKNDLYRDFKLGAKALEKSDLELTQENIPRLARFVYDQMSIDASSLLDELMSAGVELSLDVNTYKVAQRLLAHKSNGKDVPSKLNTKLFKDVNIIYGTEKNHVRAITKSKGEYKVDKSLLLPLFDLWFKNNYINSYFMNQLVMGDYAAYKNSGGQIKRYSGVKGPGIEGLIDPIAGMRPTRRVLVLGDKLNTWEETKEFFSKLLYDDNVPESTPELDKIMAGIPEKGFKPTDAQGFMTSKWIAELSRGFEASWGLGAVHKPIHFSVEREIIGDYVTGKPVYNKYSAVHLESSMTSKFPKLARLQAVLERLGIDEAIHETGVKLGVPKTLDHNGIDTALPTIEDLINYTEEDIVNFGNWKISPIMELSNSGYRMQFNAAADPNKQVSLFTQLMYFLNTYSDELDTDEFGTTQDAAKEVYNLIGELIANGREEFLKSTGSTKDGLVRFLKKNLKGAGSERALALLEAGVSIDNPLIEKKGILTLASGLEKATIKTKFKGGKLVLQTPEGAINPITGERLQYHKETLPSGKTIIVAECIVPKELLTKAQLDRINKGEALHLMPDMLGFRLPSTEFHSALAIRVVGTYSGKKSNIIIAPRELVPIQGQDFDVDALFVITQETFKETEVKLIDGVTLSKFAGTLHNLLHSLKVAQDGVTVEGTSDEDKAQLKKYKETIKKLRSDIKVISGLAIDVEETAEAKLEDRVNAIVEKLKGLPADVKDILEDVIDHVSSFRRLLLNNTIIGEADAPVGYKLEKGKYVIDTTFLETMNESLKSLEAITGTNELMPSLRTLVRNETNKVKSLKEKYIKNRVIDIMMKVISDRNNAERSLTAISFTSLDEAIKRISENGDSKSLVVSNDNLDLSHPRDQFLAYLSVSSGQILIGGFANASKSFGYISRAGGDERSFVRINTLKKSIKQLELNPEINVSQLLFPLYPDVDSEIHKSLLTEFTPVDSLKKQLAEEEKQSNFDSRYRNRDVVPILNPNQSFTIQENGKTVSYDKLAQIDSDGIYRTTETYSTLTNAAVDDLNEGYLSRGRINTNTGATIIGLTALGVPLRIAIKILYQPVLSSLSGGKLNNLEDWIQDIRKEYGDAIDRAGEETLDVGHDLDRFIFDATKHNLQGLDFKTMFEKMSPQDKESQIKVLALSIKANKVGTDFRNLAGFLNILRQWDVFIEDIEQVDDTLEDKIGTIVDLPSGEMVLKTRDDFSFNIPNLLEGSRHIKEAYVSHRALRKKIGDSFRIHSEGMNALADDINKRLDLKDKDKRNVSLNSIRHSLQDYIISGLESSDLPNSEIVTYKKGKKDELKLISSGVNVFLNRTAISLKTIKDYAQSIGDDNLFLENVVIVFDKYNTAKISFKTGVGLNPEDQIDLVTGFKDLNQYDIIDGKVVRTTPDSPTHISQLQRDLLKYSVLVSGLGYGGTGFSSYITPALIKNLDDRANEELDSLLTDIITDGFKNHFTLSYTLLNASKLDYFLKEELVPTSTNEKGKSTWAGIDTIEEKTIYYDLKAKRGEDKNGKLTKLPQYIRRDFGRKINVFKLVLLTDTAGYYQSVGRSDNAVFRPVSQTSDFSLDKQFNPYEASVAYHYIDGNKFNSYSTLLNSLKVGDELYIYPSYSYDRLERQRVKIKSKTQTDLGTQVVFEPVAILKVVAPITYPDLLPSEEVADYVTRVEQVVPQYKWARYAKDGYEVSSAGDSRFSALFAKFRDGRFIEDVYQLDLKGKGIAQPKPNDIRTYVAKQGKGLLYSYTEQYEKYKDLWRQWIGENPSLFNELKENARGKTLTDQFASTPVSQARALAELLNEDQIGEALKLKCKS